MFSCYRFTNVRGSRLPQLLIEVNLERSTWQLLYALYTDRVEAESNGDDEDMITDIMVGKSNNYNNEGVGKLELNNHSPTNNRHSCALL